MTIHERLEGYCVDLMDKIADMLDFEYEMYLVPDGTWNGLVDEVINGVRTNNIKDFVSSSSPIITIIIMKSSSSDNNINIKKRQRLQRQS